MQSQPRASALVALLLCGAALVSAGCGDTVDPPGADDAVGTDVVGDALADGITLKDAGVDAIVAEPDSEGPETGCGDDTCIGDTGEPPCPGSIGCACNTGDDCAFGICAWGTEGEKVCAGPAPLEGCPPGQALHKGACIAAFVSLCAPCGSNADCAMPGAGEMRCVAQGAWGSTCHPICTGDADCPAGTACVSRGGLKVCAADALCTCTAWAKKLGRASACGTGPCAGKRSCDAVAVGAVPTCSGAAPKTEVCNGVDDDCDGQTDDGPAGPAPCADTTCTVGRTCVAGACGGGTPRPCDDQDPCTTDTCDDKTPGGCVNTANSGPCDDGDPCTAPDTCKGGVCLPGAPTPCDDTNPCTADACVAAAGQATCTHAPTAAACEDGDPCTVGDLCAKGACSPGAPKACGDGNPCTADGCTGASGTAACTHLPADATCTDDDLCTVGDACKGGACLPGAATSCDDSNPCTTDACQPDKGCVSAPNTAPCDDGDACTLADTCKGGGCQGGPEKVCTDGNPCTDDACASAGAKAGCVFTPNQATCTDGSACTGDDQCSGGVCKPGKLAPCDDGNPCTTAFCDAAAGCQNKPNSLPCDDGDACTTGEACGKGGVGKCGGGEPVSCDDGNPCTTTTCNGATGCVALPNAATCSDGDVCTVGDQCSGGVCLPGGVTPCDDGNPCTTDACKPGGGAGAGCQHVANSLPCSDGDACTAGDQCAVTAGGAACVPGPAKVCGDGNPCTTDSCDPASGCVVVANTAPCDDGSVCTKGDTCGQGVCLPGASTSCDDGNVCTADSCAPKAGCGHAPVSGSCSDGDACTGAGSGDVCAKGVCVAGAAVDCDDDNPCTADTCDADEGCASLPATATCTDGNVCTVGDTCKGGLCLPGPATTCDDSNPCTDDACSGGQGCTHQPNAAPCSDGSLCTTGDGCAKGACVPGKAVPCDDGNPCTDDACDHTKGCVAKANTAPCDDGSACTGKDVCKGGLCTPGQPPPCDDGNPCTTAFCDSGSGCNNQPNTLPCDDGDACTVGDTCANQGGKGVCVSGAARSCADGNPCTTDGCDPGKGDKAGGCTFLPNDATCTDNDACTVGDTCGGKGAVCLPGKVTSCDDGNPCTTDLCDPSAKAGAGCSHQANTLACDDGDACTTGERCKGGACGGGAKLPCDDGNPCTDASCASAGDASGPGGCRFTANSAPCDDNDACTSGDTCKGGACLPGAAKGCDDGQVCTVDSCHPAKGCVHTAHGDACDDGDPCTAGDRCQAGACKAGAPRVCDDGNPCTDDSCVKEAKGGQPAGCVAMPNQSSCTDNDACTVGDQCQAVGSGAACVPGKARVCDDGNPCTADSCTPTGGAKPCVFTPVVIGCTDGSACTLGDVCDKGACVPGKAASCDDGNPCTDDSCDPDGKTTGAAGCAHKNNTKPCTDGSACTKGDACSGGVCTPGSPAPCDDKNPCTTETCSPGGGCKSAPNTLPCDDGDPCTTGDACGGGGKAGVCAGPGKRVCDDGNPCTSDSCGKAGCVFAANSQPCSDGNACTDKDTCKGGACAPGVAKGCDDGNACTVDACAPATGCSHTARTGGCSDGSACTLADTCVGGACKAGAALVCDDDTVCTSDACDPKQGCVFSKLSTSATCDGAVFEGRCYKRLSQLRTWAESEAACKAWGGHLVSLGSAAENAFATGLIAGAGCPNGSAYMGLSDVAKEGAYVWSDGTPLGYTNWHPGEPNNWQGDEDYGLLYGNGLWNDQFTGFKTCAICEKGTAKAPYCSDGDRCTRGDVCAGGACKAGKLATCDDGNGCTVDWCDPKGSVDSQGCTHLPAALGCSDGDACTVGDICSAGSCKAGAKADCDDGEVCTVDSCDKAKGCVHLGAATSVVCAGKTACAAAATCDGKGACAPGKAVVCDDGLACTTDFCQPGVGCRHVANGQPCRSCKEQLQATPSAPDGVYTIAPDGKTQTPVWCDMHTQGGGWTLIASYDIANQAVYAKSPFHTHDLPRNAGKPGWDDHRQGKATITALAALSTQVHARCHRAFVESPNDWLFGKIALITQTWGGLNLQVGGANPYAVSAKIRGHDAAKYTLSWYHGAGGDTWHAGVDASGSLPNSVTTEDSFTVHNGVNPKHLCHHPSGEMVWMVR